MNHIKQYALTTALSLTVASWAAMIAGGWFLALPAAVLGCFTYYVYLTKAPAYKPSDDAVWRPSKEMLMEAIIEMEAYLVENGYAKKDYRKNQNDCPDYNRAQMHVLHDILLEIIPEGLECGIPMNPFSFPRDDKDARHRVTLVWDNEGNEYYIETYRIDDGKHTLGGLLRTLTAKEILNGRIIS